MNPFRIFIFFFLVCVLLVGISFVFPDEGVRLGKEIKLRFVSVSELFVSDSSLSDYTDSLIRNTEVADDPEWEFGASDTILHEPLRLLFTEDRLVADRLFADSSTGKHSGIVAVDSIELSAASRARFAARADSLVRARIDSIRGRVHPLELSGQAAVNLERFFNAAAHAKERGELLRILHYGDSQIENDRMTALLRYRFQRVFGGSGCGMVPAIPLYSGNPVFRENYSGNWIRYTGFGKRDSTLGHSSYGLMACFTAVPPAREGSLPSLEFAFHPGKRASRFSALRLFIHSYTDSGMVVVHFDDTFTDTVRNIPDGYQELSWLPGYTAGVVKLEFGLKEGGRIYGISFDPLAGVQVDNIAMRGSSGLEFSRFDRELMDTMFAAVDPGMIIMQFGGNVVPYMRNSAAYKRFFKRELRFLQQFSSEALIVVIGPADMSTKQNGKLVTYKTLVPVRDALREAALELDCAFWDMYGAMGGENSMQDFVMADPPLATPDYIHFTPRGANLMAGMFFNALMLEYEKYRVGQ